GITIPKKILESLDLKVGDQVVLDVDQKNKIISFSPQTQAEIISEEDRKIARLTLDFINRYRSDIESLAHK
nr:AbrB/MazE/SpoVT family DNA-binding domain-containing protein [Patescibacteria group bacterium]